MTGTVVGVLRGGPSKEHDVSLRTGAAMLANLSPERYTVRDIYIDKSGTWHSRGRAVTPVNALQALDVVLIGLHGEYGEDGEVQKLLDTVGVPYAGTGAFGSYLAMHKALAKKHARDAGLLVPRDYLVESSDMAPFVVREAVRSLPQPLVVKPVRWGSSVGVSILHGYQPVLDAVMRLFNEGAGGVLLEERILGREATAGVVENMRSEALYSLPAVEIVPPSGDFFSYGAKYSGATREIVPALFPRQVNEALASAAQTMHRELGLRHYSRSDFIVSPKGIYYLETNTLPGMTTESLLPKSLAAIGVQFPDFLDHLIGLALA
jgi:D-alanine-D-alanine ligase